MHFEIRNSVTFFIMRWDGHVLRREGNNVSLKALHFELLSRIASSMRWYGHVLRKEGNNVLLKALHFELLGRIRRGRPNNVEKTSKKENA